MHRLASPAVTAVAHAPRVAAVLIAKTAIAAAPMADMQMLADRIAALPGIYVAAFGFTEQGTPSLHDVVRRLRAAGCTEILLLPMLVPMEPSFRTWLGRVLARWRAAEPEGWPTIRVASAPAALAVLGDLLAAMVDDARAAEPLAVPQPNPGEGEVIPAHKYRVLVCMGGPCNNAGGAAIWGHFRNEQIRLGLRTAGAGMMSAKTSCLGPCNLAPVVQVFPEGTYYCGVDEGGIDRIVESHLLRGEVVDDLAYAPLRTKQTLRPAKTPVPADEAI